MFCIDISNEYIHTYLPINSRVFISIFASQRIQLNRVLYFHFTRWAIIIIDEHPWGLHMFVVKQNCCVIRKQASWVEPFPKVCFKLALDHYQMLTPSSGTSYGPNKHDDGCHFPIHDAICKQVLSSSLDSCCVIILASSSGNIYLLLPPRTNERWKVRY